MTSGADRCGYHAIFETLRHEILDGKYDGTKALPSEWALARRFGVSRPTISRAVLELVREGMVVRRQGAPTALTRFAQNASGVLGIIMQGEWNYEDLYPAICRRIITIAERSGWRVVRHSLAPLRGRERVRMIKSIVERFTSEHVTGVFLQPMECMNGSEKLNQDIVAHLKAAGIHVMLLDYDIVQMPMRSDCDLVGVDNFAAGYALGCHIYERGARRVSFATVPMSAPSSAGRMHGLAVALQRCGLRWWPGENEMICNFDDPRAVAAFLRQRRPDAIVAYNDAAALQIAGSLASLGKSVPGDVMLAGFDDIPAASSATPPLTTMRQPVDDIANVAFLMLVDRIRKPNLPPRKTLLPCTLVPRASTLG